MKKAGELLKGVQARMYDEKLEEIYVDKSLLNLQVERYEKAIQKYIEKYGDSLVEIFSTPGRSEIGGNHTDHQQGMVLTASINLDVVAVVSYHDADEICVVSEGYNEIRVSLSELEPSNEDIGSTKGLIKGVVKGFLNASYKIGGFKAYMISDVLTGSGLSSSAAYEVMIGTILSGLYNDFSVSPVKIAEISQFAENFYFGKPCGLMDQMACSVGGLIHIDFKKKEEPIVEQIQVNFKDFSHHLCIIDTKGSHDDLTEDYAAIPHEMRQIAEYFGKNVLREVEENLFFMELPKLREKFSDRAVLRAIHFYGDEKRVERMIEALRQSDFTLFKTLIKESGDSSFKYLQNIYTNQDVRNQSVSIALAVSEKVLGSHGVSRVHGGGFAGTIQAFVESSYVETYKKAMDAVFSEGACRVLMIRPKGSVRVI